MGIELPAELQDVAARAGARWPEADEDAMRESATAWRAAAKSIDALAGNADGTAQGALGAFDGEAAQAARREWDAFAAPDGALLSSAKECRAAADRLDHAAEQIGAAKVQLVRELVTLAKQTDAAERAAAAGHPQALAALDSALNGAAANVAQVHNTLTAAVHLDSGVLVEPGSRGPLSTVSDAAGRALETGTELVSSTVAGSGDLAATTHGVVEGVGRAAHEAAGGVAEDVGQVAQDAVGGVGRAAQETVGGVAEGAQNAVGDVPARPWQGDVEHTGPVKVEPGGWAPGLADAGTGPIPVIGDAASSGWTPDASDPASTTAPHAVHSAWASPQAPQPPQAPLPGAAAPPQGFAPPPAGAGGHFVAPPGAPPAAAPPPASAARPPMPPAAARGPVAFGSPAPQPLPQPVQRAPLRPLPAPVQPPAPEPAAPQRPLRKGSRNADVVAFVLHQFPIGYMPVAASRASRQLPVPEAVEERRPGLNFPPQDHPQSHLVDDSDAMQRVRSAEFYAAAQRYRAERSEAEALPAELAADHEPLGELSELEWARRFLVRDGERSEYVWPPAAEFPEGGVEPAKPVVLPPDTVLDCLGSGDGRMMYAVATSFAKRSLPAAHDERDYRRYRVMRPLPVWQAVTAPWFGQPGGGMRYRATYSLTDLVGLGYLVELTKAREIAEASTLRIVRSDADADSETRDRAAERAAAPTDRITREDVDAEAAGAGVASTVRMHRGEADAAGGAATTDDGTAQEAAK
ncbi:TNT domain-containing protein [Saccharopolyspora sp. K220]|uniref:TNT domain-containing protein n=1 Tax=Saccharopolyspora soli TaxID=2926618 RepID=UPI001F597E54|nr:TNT domain-containing protein [Saccharopolyspora soli]MCI2424133.1 TNT domain-containing protein [Saccharopolyspora soli]